jgi:hypothetical protein
VVKPRVSGYPEIRPVRYPAGNRVWKSALRGGDMAAFISTCKSGEGDEDAVQKMADLFGPGHVDHTIRQSIHFCWMALPKDRKNVDELEKQVRRIVDRALKDFREDCQEFGRAT